MAALGDDAGICCSGGGFGSAPYCLGALQRLGACGLLGKAKWIIGVSGGSFIAASWALVTQGLHQEMQRLRQDGREPGDVPGAYAPGSSEEGHLRNSMHSIRGATVLAGALSLISGALVTYVVWLAPLYAVAHAWGWLLHTRGVLFRMAPPTGMTASVTAWTWWLLPAAAGAFTMVFLAYWWATMAQSGGGLVPGRLLRWAAITTAAVAVAMLAVPPVVAWLYHSTGAFRAVADFFGLAKGVSGWPKALDTLKTLAALAGVLAAVARTGLAWLARWNRLLWQGADEAEDVSQRQQTGLLARQRTWVAGSLLPWLATALVVLAGVAAALLWTGDGAAAGPSADQLWQVGVALAVMLTARVTADVNRLSMHAFNRRRVAAAFAVTRNAAQERDPRGRAMLFGRAARAQLSSLKPGDAAIPGLVICTTKYGDASPERFLMTFDPKDVRVHGEEDDQDERRRAFARTADYETLLGPDGFTLFDIAAISGTTVPPLIGVGARPAYRFLRTMTNIRLGVWLPHPRVVREARARLDHPGTFEVRDRRWTRWPVLLVLWDLLPHPLLRRRKPDMVYDRHARLWAHVLRLRETSANENERGWHRRLVAALCYRAMQPTLGLLWAEASGRAMYRRTWMCVAGAGDYDKLGLVEALRHGANHILVLDADADYPSDWLTLASSVDRAWTDTATEISMDPTTMVSADGTPGEVEKLRSGTLARPWVRGSFSSPWRRGDILVCKLGMWPGAPWAVRAYAAVHPEFPSEPRQKRRHDGAEFEAYRKLGASTVDEALGMAKASASNSIHIDVGQHLAGATGTWEPNGDERRAAWELYVELATRIAVVPVQPDNELLPEALYSLQSLADSTTDILRRYGPGVAAQKAAGQDSFGTLAVNMLTTVLRPLLATWRPALQEWEAAWKLDRSWSDHQGERPHVDELRSALDGARHMLGQYAGLFAAGSGGTPDLSVPGSSPEQIKTLKKQRGGAASE